MLVMGKCVSVCMCVSTCTCVCALTSAHSAVSVAGDL